MASVRHSIRHIELRIERTWRKTPHLPKEGQRWLAYNVWWITLIGAIISGLSVLALVNWLVQLAFPLSYYGYALVGAFTAWQEFSTTVSLVFVIVTGLLLAFAVRPLKAVQKKGWALLFIASLVQAVDIVVGALLSLSVFTFIVNIIFGGIFLAIGMYFLFEIRDQFAHVIRTTKIPPKDS